MNMNHMLYIKSVALEDVKELQHKEETYQGSWKKRGGIGAAMMTLRKIDRLEAILKDSDYDIFASINKDLSGKDGSALAEVRDLRRYLLLIEAEIQSCANGGLFGSRFPEQKVPGTPEDGGHHAKTDPEDDYADRAQWKAANAISK